MSKVLVAYFSASGVTAKLAAELAGAESADLFEIPPRVEYSLTDRGRELWPILHRLAHWATGEEYDGDDLNT